MDDNYIVLPCFALEPNKLSTFNRVFSKSRLSKTGDCLPRKTKREPIIRQHHNFSISPNAYRNLKRKINWLYYLAKSKHVKTYSGSEIYNFKIGFITLTLPSKQKTPTSLVTKELFNQFLTELRQRVKMENYVWRLEFQKNKNVHYHIVTDTYVDYFLIQKIWNRVIEKHGYVSEYQKRFNSMSLSDYNKTVNSDKKIPFDVIAKRFARGCASSWSQPNTVDVKSVNNKKNIANYISKYFGKDDKEQVICNELDTLENSKSIRLWFCSRGLSKLKSITDYCEAVKTDWFSLVSNIKNVRSVICKYARLYFFEFEDCVKFELINIHTTLKAYAHEQGYRPST